MKPTVKVLSLLLAVMMLFTAIASGCTFSKEWCYKTDDDKLDIGVYIYALYNAYNRAQTYAEKLDDYDPSKDSWLDMEITDDDGNKEVASKWIKEQAEESCLELMALEAEMKKLDATADSATLQALETDAESNWYFGTTNTEYLQYYSFTPLKDTLEPKGVSLESFKRFSANFSANCEKMFALLYLKGGSQEVKKEEITKYFEENYVKYSYLPIPLYESTTDETTGQSKNVAYDDAKIKKITDEIDKYVKQVNDTKDTAKAAETSEKLIKEFATANGMEESAISTSTGIRNETNVDTDVDKVIAELGEGKAKAIKVGKGENANYYYVFRYNMDSAKADYLTPGTNDNTIISKMKQKDFQKYLKDLAADFKHDRSDAVDSYKPDMFFVAKEPETTVATE